MIELENMASETAYELAKAMKDGTSKLGLENKIRHGNIIDIGCGPGYLLMHLREFFPEAKYHGLTWDIDAKLNNPNAVIRIGQFQNLPFDTGSMDLVVSSNIMDYAEEADAMICGQRIVPVTFKLNELLKEVERILATNGHFAPCERLKMGKIFAPENLNLFEQFFRHLNTSDVYTFYLNLYQKIS